MRLHENPMAWYLFMATAPTASIYNILAVLEVYNKQDIIITGQEQHTSTGNSPVQVTAQQRQPLLRLFLFANGGVSTRRAEVVRRQQGKKTDNKRHGI